MLTTLLLAKATHIPIYHAAFTLQNACMYAGTHPLRQSRLACSWSKSLLAWVLSMYEPSVVGKFCKARDPYLAYIAYAKGLCDDELISITNDNSMFKQQARYLIKRRQPNLWALVLVQDNIHRRAPIDQACCLQVWKVRN